MKAASQLGHLVLDEVRAAVSSAPQPVTADHDHAVRVRVRRKSSGTIRPKFHYR
jgi:hypothetical protein